MKKSSGVMPVFRYRNFRLFFAGQMVSLVGTHMQTVALGWLVLRVTDSPFWLGTVYALGTLPILLFSLPAGMLADRRSKRKLLLVTQCAFLAQAVALALLVWRGYESLWSLMALAVFQGIFQAFDSPVRQSFVSEMVSDENVQSAVALNSGLFNATRVAGQSAAGFLIHYFGEAGCFFINAASYAAVIVAIYLMRERDLFRVSRPAREHGGIMEGLRYIRSEPGIMGLIAVLIGISLFGMPSLLLLPVFARSVLHVGPKGLGFLFASAGVGAVVSAMGLAFVKRGRRQGLWVLALDTIFAVGMMAFAFSKNYALSLALIAVAGAGITSAVALTNSTLQTVSPPQMRGRVMGLYIFFFLGMMPIGSFGLGALAQAIGAPRAVLISGVVCLVLTLAAAARFPAVLRLGGPAGKSGDNTNSTAQIQP